MIKLFTGKLSIILSIVFLTVVFLAVREICKYSADPLVMQLICVTISVVVSVVTMSTILGNQAEQEKKKEFSAHLFEQKIAIYEKFLDAIFRSDDDNVVTREEIAEIENITGVIALVADEELVRVLSIFMVQLKSYGVIYERSMTVSQRESFCIYIEKNKNENDFIIKRHKLKSNQNTKGNTQDYFISIDDVVQAMRDDLSVVHGEVLHLVEKFIDIRYDQYGLIKNPNKVD